MDPDIRTSQSQIQNRLGPISVVRLSATSLLLIGALYFSFNPTRWQVLPGIWIPIIIYGLIWYIYPSEYIPAYIKPFLIVGLILLLLKDFLLPQDLFLISNLLGYLPIGLLLALHIRIRLLFQYSTTMAQAQIVDRQHILEKDEYGNPHHSYWFIVTFFAEQTDNLSQPMRVKARVSGSIFKRMEADTQVNVRYSQSNPRIFLFEGE